MNMKLKAFRRKIQKPNEAAIKHYAERIVEEYRQARTIYPPFGSFHEGKAVLEAEFEGFWEEIKNKNGVLVKVEDKLVKTGAMALGILVDMVEPFLAEDRQEKAEKSLERHL